MAIPHQWKVTLKSVGDPGPRIISVWEESQVQEEKLSQAAYWASVVDPGGPRGPGPPTPKVEAPDYILRPNLHLLTHK